MVIASTCCSVQPNCLHQQTCAASSLRRLLCIFDFSAAFSFSSFASSILHFISCRSASLVFSSWHGLSSSVWLHCHLFSIESALAVEPPESHPCFPHRPSASAVSNHSAASLTPSSASHSCHSGSSPLIHVHIYRLPH